jgi:hypothetical protein
VSNNFRRWMRIEVSRCGPLGKVKETANQNRLHGHAGALGNAGDSDGGWCSLSRQ